MGFGGTDDVRVGADGDVVVAEDAEALGSLERGEDLGADAGCSARLFVEGERTAADEVSGDEDEIGGHAVDLRRLRSRKEKSVLNPRGGYRSSGRCGSPRAVGEIADGDGEAGDLVTRGGRRVRSRPRRPGQQWRGWPPGCGVSVDAPRSDPYGRENLDAYFMIAAIAGLGFDFSAGPYNSGVNVVPLSQVK